MLTNETENKNKNNFQCECLVPILHGTLFLILAYMKNGRWGNSFGHLEQYCHHPYTPYHCSFRHWESISKRNPAVVALELEISLKWHFITSKMVVSNNKLLTNAQLQHICNDTIETKCQRNGHIRLNKLQSIF